MLPYIAYMDPMGMGTPKSSIYRLILPQKKPPVIGVPPNGKNPLPVAWRWSQGGESLKCGVWAAREWIGSNSVK